MRLVCSPLDGTELLFGLLHCIWHRKHIVGLSQQLQAYPGLLTVNDFLGLRW